MSKKKKTSVETFYLVCIHTPLLISSSLRGLDFLKNNNTELGVVTQSFLNTLTSQRR
jgi:hypothetical protein